MIATIEAPSRSRSAAAREQWRPGSLSRARITAAQLLAQERRRIRKLVEDNLDLLELSAGYHAQRYPSMDADDLRQAAYFGLARAAETWDPTHASGAAFRSWAFFGMKDYIQREIRATRSTIRVPKRATAPAPKVGSLDARRADGATFGDGLAQCDEDATPLDLAHQADLRERVAAALGKLRPNHALVVSLRFGLDGPPLLLREIAARLSVSQERIRQIEHDAFKRLRYLLAALAE